MNEPWGPAGPEGLRGPNGPDADGPHADGPDADGLGADELGGSQLRKALGTMNDLQPPTDELFAQRAVVRGRAKAYRRRSSVLGVAAAVVVAGGGVGTWWAMQGHGPATSASSAAEDTAARQGEAAGAPQLAPASPRASGPEFATTDKSRAGDTGSAAARDELGWFVGPMTTARAGLESVAPQLTSTWAREFSGAWATDESNAHLVVALTARNAEIERQVTAATGPGAVEFTVAAHSYAEKVALADRIRNDSGGLAQAGTQVVSVTQDFRNDRVVVVVHGDGAAEALTSRYGAGWVSVVVLLEPAPGKLPNGSTLPTLQR